MPVTRARGRLFPGRPASASSLRAAVAAPAVEWAGAVCADGEDEAELEALQAAAGQRIAAGQDDRPSPPPTPSPTTYAKPSTPSTALTDLRTKLSQLRAGARRRLGQELDSPG